MAMADLISPRAKSLSIIPHFTGGLSILGSSYISFTILKHRRKRRRTSQRILLALSLCDVISSFAYFLSTWPLPQGVNDGWGDPYHYAAMGNDKTCTAQGVMIQFGVVSAFYNVSLSLQYLLVVRYNVPEETLRRKYGAWMLAVPPVLALGLTLPGIFLGMYANSNLWCWIAINWDACPEDQPEICVRKTNVYRFIFYYGPLWASIALTLLAQGIIWKTVREIERRSRRYVYRVGRSSLMSSSGLSQSMARAANEVAVTASVGAVISKEGQTTTNDETGLFRSSDSNDLVANEPIIVSQQQQATCSGSGLEESFRDEPAPCGGAADGRKPQSDADRGGSGPDLEVGTPGNSSGQQKHDDCEDDDDEQSLSSDEGSQLQEDECLSESNENYNAALAPPPQSLVIESSDAASTSVDINSDEQCDVELGGGSASASGDAYADADADALSTGKVSEAAEECAPPAAQQQTAAAKELPGNSRKSCHCSDCEECDDENKDGIETPIVGLPLSSERRRSSLVRWADGDDVIEAKRRNSHSSCNTEEELHAARSKSSIISVTWGGGQKAETAADGGNKDEKDEMKQQRRKSSVSWSDHVTIERNATYSYSGNSDSNVSNNSQDTNASDKNSASRPSIRSYGIMLDNSRDGDGSNGRNQRRGSRFARARGSGSFSSHRRRSSNMTESRGSMVEQRYWKEEDRHAYRQSRKIARQAMLYFLVFFVTWFPYTFTSLVMNIWFKPSNDGYWMLLVIVVCQPLQGFLNCLVYNKRSIRRGIRTCVARR